ncbi:PREDICTED: F-box protein At1g59680-like [Camelina sativa]|uniref:F-box protein At1g59680-like n=1 Tax=Camelina sativa TaxID=90675 RepID=A0ABM1R2M3_CAMSA|nr:PREDICTED: F-box protein At1g59680-like [Camelina sativa]
MTKMSDLSVDMVGEILSRVQLTSLSAVRCNCKSWNALSKHQIFGKETYQFLGFTVMDSKVCSLRFNLQGIRNEDDDGSGHHQKIGRSKFVKIVVPTSIKQISELNQVDVSNEVFHCDDLLLCITKDRWWLMVWNPYLGEIRWIRLRQQFRACDNFTMGYDNNNPERFGPHLPLPFHSYDDEIGAVTLSCVRQEQLSLLYHNCETVESLDFWITNQVDPNAVSWSKFLKVHTGFPRNFVLRSFFIDEEKKVVVVSDEYSYVTKKTDVYQKVYIIGED